MIRSGDGFGFFRQITEDTLVEASKDDVADETNLVYDGAVAEAEGDHGCDRREPVVLHPGQSTLFLPDEQLVENTVTGTVSGTRYYTIGGSGTSTSSGTTGDASASADSSTSGLVS